MTLQFVWSYLWLNKLFYAMSLKIVQWNHFHSLVNAVTRDEIGDALVFIVECWPWCHCKLRDHFVCSHSLPFPAFFKPSSNNFRDLGIHLIELSLYQNKGKSVALPGEHLVVVIFCILDSWWVLIFIAGFFVDIWWLVWIRNSLWTCHRIC